MLVGHPPRRCVNFTSRRPVAAIKAKRLKVYCFFRQAGMGASRVARLERFRQAREMLGQAGVGFAPTPSPGHIGGLTPFFSTMARGAVMLPSGFIGARMKMAAPGFSRSSVS